LVGALLVGLLGAEAQCGAGHGVYRRRARVCAALVASQRRHAALCPRPPRPRPARAPRPAPRPVPAPCPPRSTRGRPDPRGALIVTSRRASNSHVRPPLQSPCRALPLPLPLPSGILNSKMRRVLAHSAAMNEFAYTSGIRRCRFRTAKRHRPVSPSCEFKRSGAPVEHEVMVEEEMTQIQLDQPAKLLE